MAEEPPMQLDEPEPEEPPMHLEEPDEPENVPDMNQQDVQVDQEQINQNLPQEVDSLQPQKSMQLKVKR